MMEVIRSVRASNRATAVHRDRTVEFSESRNDA
jgi:hypothetical protein